MGEISKFRGRYDFLSNFFQRDIEVFDSYFSNAEAAFQSQKDPDLTLDFMDLDPKEAKRIGRNVLLRADWDEVKDSIMEDVLRAKFTQHKDLRERLIATGSAQLIEGNTWHDNYWGICTCSKCGERGKNRLGILLMKIRDGLKPAPYQERLLTHSTTSVAYVPQFQFGFARLVCSTNPEITIGKQTYYWVLHIVKFTLEKRYGKPYCYALFGPSPFFNLSYRGGDLELDENGYFMFRDDAAKEIYRFSRLIAEELSALCTQHYRGLTS